MRMKMIRPGLVLLAVALATALSFGQASKAPQAAKPAHSIVAADTLKWNPIIPGADLAVVSGDPDKAGGQFVLRIRIKNGTKVPAHWHPTDEHVTVLRGTLLIGMGEKYDEKALQTLGTGNYVSIPKQMRHFALAKGDTILQVHGMAPFKVNWVNPAEVPALPGKAPAKK